MNKPTQNEEVISSKRKNFDILLSKIEKEGIKPSALLHESNSSLKKIREGKMKPSFFFIRRLKKVFSNVDWKGLKDGSVILDSNMDLGFEKKTAKLIYLDKYLNEKAGLSFARALSISLRKWKNLKSGFSLPSRSLLKKTAIYFCLPKEMLLDDKQKLPSFSELKVDESIATIQRGDLSETMNYYKNKHYISRNYRVLSHPMRVRMYLSLLLIVIPLVGFTAYSAYTILSDRSSSLKKMEDNNVDEASQKFMDTYIASHDKKNDATLAYCPVSIGAQVNKIYDIKASNEYFSVSLNLWFDFSQDEFHSMYKDYKDPTRAAEADSATESQKLQDVFTVNPSTDLVTYASDQIPDYIELLSPFTLKDKIDADTTATTLYKKDKIIQDNPDLSIVPQLWKEERLSYPGLHESTIYSNYSRNFDIGKGVNDSSLAYFYAPGEPYFLTDSTGANAKTYRFFQNMTFTAKVGKSYDNPRYPLETAQFWMNIEPTSWLHVSHLRYVEAPSDKNGNAIVDVSSTQTSNSNGNSTGYDYCSIDEGVFNTMGNEVAFTDGYRSVKESSSIKSHNEMVEYDVDETNPDYSYSKYTIVIRANRAAFTAGSFLPSTFLQSYINLLAVIIWIIIAFYNQSYSGEDSLGMLSTGMFSAISATIVGLQMLSDASMFSLLTMINIFTLAVILIMTYQSIMAKRAKSKDDKAIIAYNGVKLRIMFYILTLCTIVIFVGLPISAYIWTL